VPIPERRALDAYAGVSAIKQKSRMRRDDVSPGLPGCGISLAARFVTLDFKAASCFHHASACAVR